MLLTVAVNAVFFYVLKRAAAPGGSCPASSRLGGASTTGFRRWRIDGTFERLNAELRERLRVRLGRNPEPSGGIVDSQSLRTTGVRGTERGFDPAKKVEGRKRHLLVDTAGLLLGLRVHRAQGCQTRMA